MLAVVRVQARRMGLPLLSALPLVGVVLAVLGSWGCAVLPPTAVSLLAMVIPQLYVICVGACAAAALTGDALVELHEATPTGWRATQLVRLGLVLAAALVGCGLLLASPELSALWSGESEWSLTLVEPVGPVVVICLVAFVMAATSGSPQATVLAALAAWLVLALLWDPSVEGGLAVKRGIPVGVAALAALGAAWRLGNAERNVACALREEARDAS